MGQARPTLQSQYHDRGRRTAAKFETSLVYMVSSKQARAGYIVRQYYTLIHTHTRRGEPQVTEVKSEVQMSQLILKEKKQTII